MEVWSKAFPNNSRQARGEDFEPQILLIAQPEGPALENADFVVQALDEAEGGFYLALLNFEWVRRHEG